MNHFRLVLLLLFLALTACGKSSAPSHPQAEAWRDWDKPGDPRELEAYNFAHAIKLPDSLPKPVPFDFKPYEKSLFNSNARAEGRLAYFDHLCKTEAGETIFKTVDKVDGLYQMRPMPPRTTALMHDRYGFEDPADWSQGEADGSPTLFIGGPGNGFVYFESPRHPKESVNEVEFKRWTVNAWDKPEPPPYWRYHDYDYTSHPYKGPTADPEETISARYGYTWRGIRRERDREFGIAGGELMVLDLQTNEVLAVRRSFAIAKVYYGGTQLDWEFAYFCPSVLRKDGKGRDVNKIDYPFEFIMQVLHPVNFDRTKMRSIN